MPSATFLSDVNVSNAERGEFPFCPKFIVSEREEIGSISAVGSDDTNIDLIGAILLTAREASERAKAGISTEASSTSRVHEALNNELHDSVRLKFSMLSADDDMELGSGSNRSESESTHGLRSSVSPRRLGSGISNRNSQDMSARSSHHAPEVGASFRSNLGPEDSRVSFRERNDSMRRIKREARDDGWRSLCFLFSCVSFVIIIGLSIGLGKASRGKTSAVIPASVAIKAKPPSASPTNTPTTPPDEFAWCYESPELTALSEPSYARIRSALVSSGISTENDFADDVSYQRKALCWLAFGDRIELDASDPFLEQRYTLATIFYRFDEPNILIEDGWLSGKSECEWKPSVECDKRTETSVSKLQLSGNSFFQPLPKEASFLRDITHLDLSVNQFDEDVSAVIGNWSHLQHLKLSSNKFTTLPSALLNWKGLVHFDISDNELTGPIPERLASSTQLTYLDLALNQLQGTIPVKFGNLTSLETLYLHGNQLEGSVPESVCALRDGGVLTTLSVDCKLVKSDCHTDCDNYNPDKDPFG